MSLNDSFLFLLQFAVPMMSAPSFNNFCVVVTGGKVKKGDKAAVLEE